MTVTVVESDAVPMGMAPDPSFKLGLRQACWASHHRRPAAHEPTFAAAEPASAPAADEAPTWTSEACVVGAAGSHGAWEGITLTSDASDVILSGFYGKTDNTLHTHESMSTKTGVGLAFFMLREKA